MHTTKASTPMHFSLSLTALKTLAEAPALHCGALSPLARIAPPPDAADPAALREALQQQDGGNALATLLEPGLLLTLVLDDPDAPALGSWIFASADGSGQGWRVEVDADALGLGGPVALRDVAAALSDWLALGGVGTLAPVRLDLNAHQCWALLTVADAWQGLQSLRLGLRLPGAPLALTRADLELSWTQASSTRRTGYAVARALLLTPDQDPGPIKDWLLVALDALERADLLVQLPGAPEQPDDSVLLPTDGLATLCAALAGARGFGLLRAEAQDSSVQLACVLGWRSPGGIALLDLSALANDHAELFLCGPETAGPLLDHLLGPGAVPADPGRLGARLAELQAKVDASIAAVPAVASAPTRHAAPAATPAGRYCSQCGAEVKAAARFCGSCGARL